MSSQENSHNTILVAGGGIGGFAAALAIVKQGFKVKVFEQAPEIGEIGAGMQLGPNAFNAFDALGVGEEARKLAVYTDYMVMHDAINAHQVGKITTGDDFLNHFGNPYAVIHRADIHMTLVNAAKNRGDIEIFTDTRIVDINQSENEVSVTDQKGNTYTGVALIGADGVKSVVRAKYVGDEALPTGHVVYRAVVPKDEFPDELKWNAASIWVGPKCHLVHYPLRGGEEYNVVVTFHSRDKEEWSVKDGSKEEVESYFTEVCPKARQLIELPKSWKRWATADRDPIEQWTFGRVTLLGDAAHPTTQYMAQGACMALEDAVTLGETLRTNPNDIPQALDIYQQARVARTARIVLSSRQMGRIYHADGVERMIRNQMWQGRDDTGFYNAMEWLYNWKVDNCLDAVPFYTAKTTANIHTNSHKETQHAAV